MNCIIIILSIIPYTIGLNIEDQMNDISAARCYSKCLQIFIRFKTDFIDKLSKPVAGHSTISPVSNPGLPQLTFVDEMAHHLSVTELSLRSCLEDRKNQCSRQCFKSCGSINEGSCQQNDIGCVMASHFRKEVTREGANDDCPFISNFEESTLKIPVTRCPKMCKSKLDCNLNQLCCSTETCGQICLEIDGLKVNLPKYTPTPTQSSTNGNIEFDWSDTFSKHLKNESPLVFILQTRTCLCYKLVDKYISPWETLIMTHRLGAKLDALDNGTIYQFRFAAVTTYGTNGYGSISQTLPLSVHNPSPPFPPENLLEYKWQVTDEKLFKVEIRWSEPKLSLWRSYEYFLSWMVDHGVVQSGGEPMSSLTQFTKVLSGSDRHCTIERLKPSTTYKIQMVTKVDWPGYGDIMSQPATLFVTTPMISLDNSLEDFVVNSEIKSCYCPEPKVDRRDIKIHTVNFLNGDLQVTIDMGKNSDYMIDCYPEVCINHIDEKKQRNSNRFKRLYKQTSEVTVDNLQFNCRYSVEIVDVLKANPKVTYQHCFCTPPCHTTYHGKNCLKDDISGIPSPKDVKYSLYNYDTMTYKVSWKAMNNKLLLLNMKPGIAKYRVLWAPRKFEPVPLDHYNGIIGFDPIFDIDRSDVRIIKSNITRLLLHNLTKYQLYIVRIQSIAILDNGQLLESHPITIFLPTYGYTDLYYHNSQTNLIANRLLVLMMLRWIYQTITFMK